jgi:hypothetical protein
LTRGVLSRLDSALVCDGLLGVFHSLASVIYAAPTELVAFQNDEATNIPPLTGLSDKWHAPTVHGLGVRPKEAPLGAESL